MTGVEQEGNATLDQQIRDWPAMASQYHVVEHGRVDRRAFQKRQRAPHIVRRSQHDRARRRDCLAEVQANDRIVLNYENVNVFKR